MGAGGEVVEGETVVVVVVMEGWTACLRLPPYMPAVTMTPVAAPTAAAIPKEIFDIL